MDLESEHRLFSWDREEFRGYRWGRLKYDLYAGLTVSLVLIPQAIAYALVAGVPIAAGLLCAIYASFLSSLLSSSRQLMVGPTNSVALLVHSAVAEILFTYYRDLDGWSRGLVGMQILTQLALMVGILQILAACLRLGMLTQFVSRSVIVGYITGAAFAIILGQLYIFCGIQTSTEASSLVGKAVYLGTHIWELHGPTLTFGALSLMVFVLLRMKFSKIPHAALMLGVMAFSLYLIRIQTHSEITQGIRVLGDLQDLGHFHFDVSWPFFNPEIMNSLFPIAFAIALLGILEATAVSSNIAQQSGQDLLVNRDILALGIANFSGAFLGAMPASGSPSRSSLNHSLGASTRLAGMFCSVFTWALVSILTPFLYYVPLASLSALLLVIAATGMVDRKQFFLCFRATKSDQAVLLATLGAALFFSLDIAFYIGVGLSITLYLRKAGRPNVVEESWEKGPEEEEKAREAIRVIDVQGELFFGAAGRLHDSLKSVIEDPETQVVLLRLQGARNLDATACLVLGLLYDQLRSRKKHLLACGLNLEVWEVWSKSGLLKRIGAENIFAMRGGDAGESLRNALARAYVLAKKEEDTALQCYAEIT